MNDTHMDTESQVAAEVRQKKAIAPSAEQDERAQPADSRHRGANVEVGGGGDAVAKGDVPDFSGRAEQKLYAGSAKGLERPSLSHQTFMESGDADFVAVQRLLFGKGSEHEAFQRLHEAASGGCQNVLMVTLLAFCHEFGIGTSVDYAAAFRHYEAAAKAGEGIAQTRLIFLMRHGRPGIRINRLQAEKWQERLVASTTAVTLQWLMYAAVIHDHPAAQYCLGICYHDGLGVEKDPVEAVKWYRQSAEQGHARSQGILGYCYGQGVGVPKDQLAALGWYRKAAAQNESVAIYNIGYCFEEGLGVTKDDREAVLWYERAALMGNAFAQNSLGYCYEDGIGVGRDVHKAVKWYTLSSEQGYAWAQCNLGFCLQNGIGCEKDSEAGASWYYEAAIQGYPRAQHNYGYCMQNGIGVPRDPAQAIVWYQRAADQNNTFAFHSLGYCYQNGIGVERDGTAALHWFERAAEAGHAPAQLSLGYCYRNGVGGVKDDKKVFYWFTKCAEGGNAIAQNSLGYCYESGIGTAPNGKMAFVWYSRAAIKKYAWAQYNLGHCFQDGIGTDVDEKVAFHWYRLAAEQKLAQAQLRVAQFYERGISDAEEGGEEEALSGDACEGGTARRQEEKAFRWYLRAAMNNSIPAQLFLGQAYEDGRGRIQADMTQALRWYNAAATNGDRNATERVRQLMLATFGVASLGETAMTDGDAPRDVMRHAASAA